MRLAPIVALLVSMAAATASAQSVSMGGSLGHNALLVIDGKPRNVAVGATVAGVKLVSVSANDAVVEVGGKRVALQLGGAQVNLGGKQSEGSGKQIVLTADGAGHFFTAGTINGKAVRFVVDTGATTVALSQDEADRLGLDYKSGQRGLTRTANGVAPFYRVALASLRIGDVQVYNVDATVSPAAMPFILLGNSYLTRFQMKRENDVMTLDLRY
jgi:aspartyl protease family protein